MAEEFRNEKNEKLKNEKKVKEEKGVNSPVLAIMRPETYREKSEALALTYGFEPLYAPMIRLEGLKDEGFEPFVQRVLGGLSDYVIFTSANGITFTMNKLSESESENFLEALRKLRVIAIGPNTKKELVKIGIENPFLPGDYSSEGIVKALCQEVKGKTVDLARSKFGAALLLKGLEECGATVYETHVYTLNILEGEAQKKLIERALAGEVDAFAFTSSMMIKGFMRNAEKAGAEEAIKEILKNALVGTIGNPTAKTLENYGLRADVIPEEFTFEALLAALKNKFLEANS
jgi:uroporphyrinogen-III synthase